MTIELSDLLTVLDVRAVADGEPIALGQAARERISRSRELTERLLADGERVYGLTTGVGALKRVDVTAAQQAPFNRLLLQSHRTGTGASAPARVVRAAMVAQLGGFSAGRSGVGLALAERLERALNRGFAPAVRTIGSLGQSDLGPLADLACGLLDEPSLGEPWEPTSKEALAFCNSNAFSLGWSALALADATRTLTRLDEAAALTFEGMLGNVQALDPAIAEARPTPGLADSIARLRALLAGGALLAAGDLHRELQDPLSLRVTPQTHAAAHLALQHATMIVEVELTSSHDNPAITPDGRALSNGNFDSIPYGVALDYLRLALAHAITISCERTHKLLTSAFSGLPSGLRDHDDSSEDGLGISVYGATAAAAEARLLAQPTTLDLPTTSTAEGIEDRVSSVTLAARRLEEQAALGCYVAAVESYCAAQAIDLRDRSAELGEGTRKAYDRVRAVAPRRQMGEPPLTDFSALL